MVGLTSYKAVKVLQEIYDEGNVVEFSRLLLIKKLNTELSTIDSSALTRAINSLIDSELIIPNNDKKTIFTYVYSKINRAKPEEPE